MFIDFRIKGVQHKNAQSVRFVLFFQVPDKNLSSQLPIVALFHCIVIAADWFFQAGKTANQSLKKNNYMTNL